jgi:thiol-disulfide isomerase/thioredoxin
MVRASKVGILGSVLIASVVSAGTARAAAEDGKIVADLKVNPTHLDWEGNKKAMQMYMPSGSKLSAEKPAAVTKEPKYAGTPKYGIVKLGNGTPNEFVIVVDEVTGGDSKIYVDKDADGDLTNDGDGSWAVKEVGQSGTNYRGTYVFDVKYKDDAGHASEGQYGLNMYWSTGRESVFYYRAGAALGKVTIDGKTFDVTVIENDNDGLYNKLYDGSGAVPTTKPMYLVLDRNEYDIRGSVTINDTNYIAKVSPDGTKLELSPTAKVIRLPRPMPKEVEITAIKVGAVAPDFTVSGWSGAGVAGPEIKLSSYRGKSVVVVDFWATWCGPCMRGLPHLSKVAESAKGQDVVFLAVNTWDEAQPYETFVTEKGKDFAVQFVRDPAGRAVDSSIARKSYGVKGIPGQFVIGKDGKVLAIISGYQDGDKTLENALKEAGIKLD